jgi:TonB family protein
MEMEPVEAAAGAPAGTPANMRIHVLTPPHEEAAQLDQSNGPSQVSAGVMAGNIVSKVTPVYPQAAKDAKVQGAVVLDAVIGKDGAMKSLKFVSGPPELQMSAMEAVRQWTYKPYLLNGQPTEVETTITVNYSLAP